MNPRGHAPGWLERWYLVLLPASLALSGAALFGAIEAWTWILYEPASRSFLACDLSLVPSAWAAYGSEDRRLEKLYSSFISPCCWRENLTVHDSQIAQEMRGRIRSMVHDGKTDDQIKSVFVAQYTKRILALPEGPEQLWLFWTRWLLAWGSPRRVVVPARATSDPPGFSVRRTACGGTRRWLGRGLDIDFHREAAVRPPVPRFLSKGSS